MCKICVLNKYQVWKDHQKSDSWKKSWRDYFVSAGFVSFLSLPLLLFFSLFSFFFFFSSYCWCSFDKVSNIQNVSNVACLSAQLRRYLCFQECFLLTFGVSFATTPSSFPGSLSSLQLRTFCFIFLLWLPVIPSHPHSSGFLHPVLISVSEGRKLLYSEKEKREI